MFKSTVTIVLGLPSTTLFNESVTVLYIYQYYLLQYFYFQIDLTNTKGNKVVKKGSSKRKKE